MHLLAIPILFLFSLAPSRALPNHNDDWDGRDGHFPRHGCLSDRAAEQIVSVFESFFVKIDTNLAQNFLTPDFQEYSDSINNLTLGAAFKPGLATATSRANFTAIENITQKQPQPNFTTLAVYHSCDTITFRWHLNFPIPVAGIDVLIIKPGSHLIQTDYSEFNTLGLVANAGFCLA